ncbi:hypothetical protein J7E45_17760 [Microbacterium sp. ISL-59]|uniref:hypothetical protein n=1 Tax=Microbacterium sp. ISL-59 TaxID=2819159 RepID=UPI001BEB12E9|nr:hypothetical protein [Microbacterium sp. ISL-59]MBT2497455.1 hypothetical protein [Microbacterium sp. ISL-59]
MAISRNAGTPTTGRPNTDLSEAFDPAVPKSDSREYTRKVGILFTPEQYAAIEQAVLDRGWPRHGGPSRLVREVVAKELGFRP